MSCTAYISGVPHTETGEESICKHDVSERTGCSDKRPSITEDSKFSFTFFSCCTPVVDAINVNNGTINTKIIITGNGFSADKCQNEVRLGSSNCKLISATYHSLACFIERNSSNLPAVAVLHQLNVRVNNRGFAQINISSPKKSGFAIQPNIESIFPSRGSLAGGARLTIKGFGFDGLLFVTIGGYHCITLKLSYLEVVCEVPPSYSEGESDILVFIYIGEVPIQAKCETESGKCTYTYILTCTPVMSQITPDTFLSNVPFNITGTFLGNITDEFEVLIGNISAVLMEVHETYIIATLSNIPAGDNDVIIWVKDYGKASGVLTVHGTLTVSSLYLPSGSIYGNTTITVFGNGFMTNKTTISFGGSNCIVLSTNLSHVICLTTPHSAGSVIVSVATNGLTTSYNPFIYAEASTPTVVSVRPTSGFPGDTLTISGSNLKSHSTTVFLGEATCEVMSVDTDEIGCIIGHHPTGKVNISVMVDGLGFSNADVTFEYHLGLLRISPNQGKFSFSS